MKLRWGFVFQLYDPRAADNEISARSFHKSILEFTAPPGRIADDLN